MKWDGACCVDGELESDHIRMYTHAQQPQDSITIMPIPLVQIKIINSYFLVDS